MVVAFVVTKFPRELTLVHKCHKRTSQLRTSGLYYDELKLLVSDVIVSQKGIIKMVVKKMLSFGGPTLKKIKIKIIKVE